MSKVVWKFPLTMDGSETIIGTPRNYQFLSLQIQAGRPMLWAIVDPDSEVVERRIVEVGTGMPVPPNTVNFYGTLQFYEGSLVLHYFEVSHE